MGEKIAWWRPNFFWCHHRNASAAFWGLPDSTPLWMNSASIIFTPDTRTNRRRPSPAAWVIRTGIDQCSLSCLNPCLLATDFRFSVQVFGGRAFAEIYDAFFYPSPELSDFESSSRASRALHLPIVVAGNPLGRHILA